MFSADFSVQHITLVNGTYKALFDLVNEKDYFVITTNVDHQFQNAGFDRTRLFYTQGDWVDNRRGVE